MSADDTKKHLLVVAEDDDQGSGGQGSGIAFTDFTGSVVHSRDDLMPDEKKRLLWVHGQVNAENVKKQKEKREKNIALKDGKISLAAHREGKGSGMHAEYLNHPRLSHEAQFSGIDSQDNPLPTENKAETNEADKNELENEFRLLHKPELTPRPSIAPRPYYNK